MAGFNQAGGSIGGGTGVSSATPGPAEMAAQIRTLATKCGSASTYSNIVSMLDPMYDLFQRNEKKNPSVAEGAAKWVFDTSKELEKDFEKGAEKIFDTGAKGAEKIFDTGVKGAEKIFDTGVKGAGKIIDTAQQGASKIISDILHNPGSLFC